MYVCIYTISSSSSSSSSTYIQWNDTNAEATLDRIKNKPTKMIIEYVRDGASFRAILAEDNTYVNLSLAGVQAPRVNTAPRAGR